jgi:hypothetical protein
MSLSYAIVPVYSVATYTVQSKFGCLPNDDDDGQVNNTNILKCAV